MAGKLKDSQPSRRFRKRAILNWFGAKRAGTNVVSEIEAMLTQYGLETIPDLRNVGIDEQVQFVKASKADEPLTVPDTVTDIPVEATMTNLKERMGTSVPKPNPMIGP